MALVRRSRLQTVQDEVKSRYLELVPPLFEPGHLSEFLASGRTTQFALSPRSNSLVVYPAPLLPQGVLSGGSVEDLPIYVSTFSRPPTENRRAFIADTSVVFAQTLGYINGIRKLEPEGLRTRNDITSCRKFADDYIRHIQDFWMLEMNASRDDDEETSWYIGDHYRSLYSAFSLFQILYTPEDGVEDVPVGDELLEWLNTLFVEPSTEEGNRLSELERSWEDDLFWPYLIRSTMRGLMKSSKFFFRRLLNHPSENLRLISEKMITLLDNHPRQKNFVTEKEFSIAARRWRDRVKALRIDLDRVPEHDRSDGFENWWENMSDLLGIMEGRGDILERMCLALGGSWKEMICVYGIWVDVSLRRNELPEAVGSILSSMAPDPTDYEDALHLELVMGRPTQALSLAHRMDPWLSAHLVDIMSVLCLLGPIVDDDTGVSIRDYYVLSYTEHLQSDPGLWRLTVNYLCTCGEIGMEMADEVLMRVPLEFNDSQTFKTNSREGNGTVFMDVAEEKQRQQDESSSLSAIVKELNATCYEYQREHTRRVICQIAARKLAKLKKYGLAISYCRSSEDWTMLGHIVETLMEEYISQGARVYVSLAADIAPCIPELRVEPGPQGIFIHRLKFAVRYSDFHRRKIQGDLENALLDLVSMFVEDLAPRAWWSVLLHDAISFFENERELAISTSDACLLLRRLEEVTLWANQGYGDDYLGILARVLRVDRPEEALAKLDDLRLALARYLARCNLPGSLLSDPSTDEVEILA